MIDFSFISKLEGSSRKACVPAPTQSKSGVTIASGFDIGQCSADEIEKAFTPELAKKLVPYVATIKMNAVKLLEQKPLEITEQEEKIINTYSHSTAEYRLKKLWKNANPKVDFDNLDDICQTVIASVSFQYGNLAIKTPNFWQQIISGNWSAALKNLRNFGDKYPTRRNNEADLLAQYIEK